MFDLRSDAGIDAAYRAYGAGLHALARRVLDDLGLAEEAVQETFVRAWRSAHTFDAGSGSQKGWLFAICRNTSVALYRHRRIRPAVPRINLQLTVRSQRQSTSSIGRCVDGSSRRRCDVSPPSTGSS